MIGFLKMDKAVQETKRELWELDGVELMIDSYIPDVMHNSEKPKIS